MRRGKSSGCDLLAAGVDRAAGGHGAGAAAGIHPGPEDGPGHPGRDGLHQVLRPGGIRVADRITAVRDAVTAVSDSTATTLAALLYTIVQDGPGNR